MKDWLLPGLTFASVIVVLWAEARKKRRLVWLFKPLASTGFLLFALQMGALETDYGKAVFAALFLSWFGDVFLIVKEKWGFLAGLVSFLLGHLAFAVAFLVKGVSLQASGIAVAALLVPAFFVGRWLFPHVGGKLLRPVQAYFAVITLMVALAVGVVVAGGSLWIPVAAVAFYLSDLAVARDAFVAPGIVNRLWGLPLYYGAQLLFAWTVAC